MVTEPRRKSVELSLRRLSDVLLNGNDPAGDIEAALSVRRPCRVRLEIDPAG